MGPVLNHQDRGINVFQFSFFLHALPQDFSFFFNRKEYYKILFVGHPRFFNQLSCGLDITSLAGEWLTAAANTNMFTYEIAPVFILMEHECLKKMREIIG